MGKNKGSGSTSPQGPNPASSNPQTGAVTGSAAPLALASSDVELTRVDFLWKTHSYTNDYIRFADPKAAILIAIASGLIAALFTAKCHLLCAPGRLSWAEATAKATFLGAASLLAFCLLGLSVIFGSWAVAPRLWRTFVRGVVQRLLRRLATAVQPQAKPQAGLIFWGDILLHHDENAYWQAVSALAPSQMSEAIAKHVYVLAGIADAKYTWVKWATICGYAGAVFACIVLLLAS